MCNNFFAVDPQSTFVSISVQTALLLCRYHHGADPSSRTYFDCTRRKAFSKMRNSICLMHGSQQKSVHHGDVEKALQTDFGSSRSLLSLVASSSNHGAGYQRVPGPLLQGREDENLDTFDFPILMLIYCPSVPFRSDLYRLRNVFSSPRL